MKKLKNLVLVSLIALSASWAGSARATTIAGWDFSQWLAPGALTVDGATGTNVLSANYSNLDPGTGAGPNSAPFGAMYMNGQYGSTNVDPTSGSAQFIPVDVDLISNINAPTAPGQTFVPFGSLTDLQVEGQLFANPLGMSAQGASSIVFAANLSSVPQMGADWVLSFGARTYAGTTSVAIDFSTNGINYSSFGSVNLTATDTPFNVALGTAATDFAFIRLTFGTPGAGGASQPIIDNLAIGARLVPEPSAAALVGLGLAMAALTGVRRKAAQV